MTARYNALVAGSALALFTLIGAAPTTTLAQEATPVAEVATAPAATPVAAAPVSRPARISAGECAALGEVVQPLTTLTAPLGTAIGQADRATRAESSFTNVPVTLDALFAADYAIDVRLSEESIGTALVCGEIGGVLDANGALIVGLREMSNSGYTGIAYLQPGIDAVSTDVSVFIAPVFGPAG